MAQRGRPNAFPAFLFFKFFIFSIEEKLFFFGGGELAPLTFRHCFAFALMYLFEKF